MAVDVLDHREGRVAGGAGCRSAPGAGTPGHRHARPGAAQQADELMPTSRHGCPAPGCPVVLPAGTRRCPRHARAHEQTRGSRQQRGYDREHDKLRAWWAPRVATGTVTCWRCGERIAGDEPFDLGHDDQNRELHRGPEHTRCNRAAAGRAAHRRTDQGAPLGGPAASTNGEAFGCRRRFPGSGGKA
jgi:hypothetical protein